MTATPAANSPFEISRARQSPSELAMISIAREGAHERSVLVGGVLPHEVDGVDQMKLAVRESFVEVRRVDRRDDPVPAAAYDLPRRLYPRQEIAELQFRWVGLNVADRFCEPLAFVRCQVVLARGAAEREALEGFDRALDDRASADPAIRLEIRGVHPFTQGGSPVIASHWRWHRSLRC
jgi:hypothetical protein